MHNGMFNHGGMAALASLQTVQRTWSVNRAGYHRGTAGISRRHRNSATYGTGPFGISPKRYHAEQARLAERVKRGLSFSALGAFLISPVLKAAMVEQIERAKINRAPRGAAPKGKAATTLATLDLDTLRDGAEHGDEAMKAEYAQRLATADAAIAIAPKRKSRAKAKP